VWHGGHTQLKVGELEDVEFHLEILPGRVWLAAVVLVPVQEGVQLAVQRDTVTVLLKLG